MQRLFSVYVYIRLQIDNSANPLILMNVLHSMNRSDFELTIILFSVVFIFSFISLNKSDVMTMFDYHTKCKQSLRVN